MSDHESPSQPHDLIDIKNIDPEPIPLPQYQLLDDCEIGNFLRDRPDDIANSFNFSNPEPNPNSQDLNFYHRPQQHKNHPNYTHMQSQDSYAQSQYNHRTSNQSYYQSQDPIPEPSEQKAKPTRKCICKKTQCLKMYCECFASNLPCTELCACIECKNTSKHQKQIVEAKQMIQQKGIVGLHSCSLSQKRCNCKKSNCLKKYCECYNSGVKCSEACKCESCKNCDNNPNEESENENEKVTKAPKPVKAKKEKKKLKVEVKI